eukprot:TRINITY_DN2969_c0_g1_i2.p1 TRINITY_DN2969_c0_g1~~TRINITY_DN2969_c0_g1_i2.p1  ORF type:complete len:346 (+),score=99.73 TRINITY_DN2969_c0_g1_i2:52-1089(+)
MCFFRFLFFFFSSRRRHTRSCLVSWARRCVQETGNILDELPEIQNNINQFQEQLKKIEKNSQKLVESKVIVTKDGARFKQDKQFEEFFRKKNQNRNDVMNQNSQLTESQDQNANNVQSPRKTLGPQNANNKKNFQGDDKQKIDMKDLNDGNIVNEKFYDFQKINEEKMASNYQQIKDQIENENNSLYEQNENLPTTIENISKIDIVDIDQVLQNSKEKKDTNKDAVPDIVETNCYFQHYTKTFIQRDISPIARYIASSKNQANLQFDEELENKKLNSISFDDITFDWRCANYSNLLDIVSDKIPAKILFKICLLYTSDAADDMQCVDLGGRRIIKKKKKQWTKQR